MVLYDNEERLLMSIKDSVRITELEKKVDSLHESFHRLEEMVVDLMHQPIKEHHNRGEKKKKNRR